MFGVLLSVTLLKSAPFLFSEPAILPPPLATQIVVDGVVLAIPTDTEVYFGGMNISQGRVRFSEHPRYQELVVASEAFPTLAYCLPEAADPVQISEFDWQRIDTLREAEVCLTYALDVIETPEQTQIFLEDIGFAFTRHTHWEREGAYGESQLIGASWFPRPARLGRPMYPVSGWFMAYNLSLTISFDRQFHIRDVIMSYSFL